MHELYRQVNITAVESRQDTNVHKVLRIISEKGDPTVREIGQFTGLSSEEAESIIDQLFQEEKVIKNVVGKTVRVSLAAPVNQGQVDHSLEVDWRHSGIQTDCTNIGG